VHIGGVALPDFCAGCQKNCGMAVKDDIFHQVKNAAYHLIEKKGATYHAIGLATLTIIDAIFSNQNSIMTVSSYLDDYLDINDVCLSVPTKMNRSGVGEKLVLSLTYDELKKLHHSADVLKDAIHKVGLKI